MKLISKCKPVPIATGFKLPKMHGHMDITLTNVKTGEVEEIHHDNIITNAIQYYFANCGFMNYPSIDKAQLVELLMGGIMCFDDVIDGDDPSPTTVHAPAGLKMTANAAQGYTSNLDGEQGTATANTTTTTYNGWQADGSYLHTYEWNTGQGNGAISSVCLAGRNYAWAGEGNSTSLRRHGTKADITNLAGGANSHSGVTGYPFNINLTDSTCHTFAIETRTDQEEQTYTTGVLRQYRLPITKLDLRGKPTAPVLISEDEVEIDSDLINATCKLTQPLGTKLLIWNNAKASSSSGPLPTWGSNYTQYLWELSPDGTLTKTTVTNTTGDTLCCLGPAIFDGNYCYFIKTASHQVSGYYYYRADLYASTVYIWNRTSGVMTKVINPYTIQGAITIGDAFADLNYRNNNYQLGWVFHHGTGEGKIITTGTYPIAIDAVNEDVYPTNANETYLGNMFGTLSPLIRAIGLNLYRDQGYIASINNLDSPVVKTSEKSMKITYRITFEEEESNA